MAGYADREREGRAMRNAGHRCEQLQKVTAAERKRDELRRARRYLAVMLVSADRSLQPEYHKCHSNKADDVTT